jgi:N-glycosylase/DNA lyase
MPEITLAGRQPFSLSLSLFSGQVFYWEKSGNAFQGDVLGDYATVGYDGKDKKIFFEGTTKGKIVEFFDLETDYFAIEKKLCCTDPFFSPLVTDYSGLRILRQDPWQAAVSFVVSQNNNIPRIRKILGAMREKFGAKTGRPSADSSAVYSFPTADALASAPISSLSSTGLGYRAPYIKSLARAVVEGSIDFSELSKMDYFVAQKTLVCVHGVGPKVADCILLYGLHNTGAFPADVWVRRAMVRHYKE